MKVSSVKSFWLAVSGDTRLHLTAHAVGKSKAISYSLTLTLSMRI